MRMSGFVHSSMSSSISASVALATLSASSPPLRRPVASTARQRQTDLGFEHLVWVCKFGESKLMGVEVGPVMREGDQALLCFVQESQGRLTSLPRAPC